MVEAFALLVAATVVAALYFGTTQTMFVVKVRVGKAEATRGTVTDAFLAAVEEVCREFGLRLAEVRGVLRGARRIALQFSSNFPEAARQRLRNWWAMSGWPAPGR
jgi:hypothetical protein